MGCLALLACSMVACKSKKLVVAPPPVAKADTVDRAKVETLALLAGKNTSFQTLAMKGKAELRMNNQENNVTVNVRLLRDKKIWVSITAIAGIEVARALITPDSLQVINRMQGLVLLKPFSYIHRYANREVNFKLLQDLLTGNAPVDFLQQETKLTSNNGVWQAAGNRNGLGYLILFNTLLKSAETRLNDPRVNQSVKVVYNEYQSVDDLLYPSKMQLHSVTGTRKVDIAFEFSKLERNVPLDFSFTVPKRAQVIN